MKQTASAVVLAAGSSSRMGFDKLGFDLGGETVLGRSLRAFDACPRIGEIVLVTGRDTALAGREAARCRKPVRLVQGGDTRAESARRGVEAAGGELVAIHDAARPFVSQAVIEAALQGAAQWGAAAPAVPLKDTVKRGTPGDGRTVPASCLVDVTPDRSSLYAVQTPQCFDRDTYLRVSGQLDPERARMVTDDASLFELAGLPVRLTAGDYANYKITTREDLPGGGIQQGENAMRIGHGYDVHRLVEGRPLILGGVNVPFEKGLLGHSDADVLAHAVMDAVLGAAALGGHRAAFPRQRPRLRRGRQSGAGPPCGRAPAPGRLAGGQYRRHHPLPAAQAGPPYPRHAPQPGRSLWPAGGWGEREGHHRGTPRVYRGGAGHRGPRRGPDPASVTGVNSNELEFHHRQFPNL